MSVRFASRLAWSLCAAALVLYALALLMILLARSEAGDFAWRAQAIDVVGSVGAPVLGGLIASRRPESPIGWMWLGIGLGFALSSFGGSYATYALGPGTLPAPRTLGTLVAGMGWIGAITLMPLLLLVFPDGRLPSRRWRFLAWTVVAAGTLVLILGPFAPGRSGFAPVENPFGVGGAAGQAIFVLVNAGVVVVLIAIVLSALSLVFRFRRAVGDERQQIKWFAYAAVLFSSLIPLDLLGLSGLFGDLPWSMLNTVTVLGLYAAIGVAILKHRLYEIDLIINRTLVYATLTVTLALLYLGGVVVLQALFRALAGSESRLAVVASTLAIAALFVPLRRRVQGFVDRRFYRSKYDATKTLEAFSSKLRDETDLDRLGEELVSVVHGTMQPEHVSLWLRPAVGEKK